jgi:hypothetical protein
MKSDYYRHHHLFRHMSSTSRLLRIMPPILQALVTPALRILLRLLLLREVSLTITHHLAHVLQVLIIVLLGVPLRVLLQDLDYLAAALARRERANVSQLRVYC